MIAGLMSNRVDSLLVPIRLIIVTLLTLVTAPSSWAHGRVDESVDTIVEIVGTESIRELGRAGLRAKIEATLIQAGVNVNDPRVQSRINQALDDIFNRDMDATTLSFTSFTFSDSRDQNGRITSLDINSNIDIVTFEPSGASDQLKNHEEGHRQIFEEGTSMLHNTFTRMHDGDIGKPFSDKQVESQLQSGEDRIDNITNLAGSIYDRTTQNGTEGGSNQQEIAESSLTIAKLLSRGRLF